jgi:succinate dehydrogenase / fumarate reductase cytochrome b subunit
MNKRPVYLNLMRLHLPLMGWVSILHRVTGIVLFLALPVCLYVLQRSLSSDADYADIASLMAQPWAKLVLLGTGGSLAHHVFAGMRHLAMDVHCGVEKHLARLSARLVLVASALTTLVLAWRLFL